MIKEEKPQLKRLDVKTGQNIEEIKKVSQESIEEFKKLFRSSLEKLKEYGVKQGLLDPKTPLEQVHAKLIEKIKELNEREIQRRTESIETERKEKRIHKDCRQS